MLSEYEIKAIKDEIDEINKYLNLYQLKSREQNIADKQKYIGNTYMLKEDRCTTYYKILKICDNNDYRAYTLVIRIANDINEKDDNVKSDMYIDDIGWWCIDLLNTYKNHNNPTNSSVKFINRPDIIKIDDNVYTKAIQQYKLYIDTIIENNKLTYDEYCNKCKDNNEIPKERRDFYYD